MARKLSQAEEKEFLQNREELCKELTDLEADLRDLPDEELADFRHTMLNRVNICMELILESK